jgi:hypothetical protein
VCGTAGRWPFFDDVERSDHVQGMQLFFTVVEWGKVVGAVNCGNVFVS